MLEIYIQMLEIYIERKRPFPRKFNIWYWVYKVRRRFPYVLIAAMNIVKDIMRYLGGRVEKLMNYEVWHIKTNDVNMERMMVGSTDLGGWPRRLSPRMMQ